MTVMLCTRSLAKSFTLHLRGGVRMPVLSGIDIDVNAGECIVLSGPSGAGKSTLMRSLYGNYRADSGAILVRHHGTMVDIAAADPAHRPGCAAATRSGLSASSCASCHGCPRWMWWPRSCWRADHRRRRRPARTLLQRLHIPSRLHAIPPATFSGGEQQRVNLARGFIAGLPILLLDEPTAPWTPKTARW